MAAEGGVYAAVRHVRESRQWGRDRMAAEGEAPARAPLAMGLRQWGRDRMAAEGCKPPGLAPWGLASMGPRPDGRGRSF